MMNKQKTAYLNIWEYPSRLDDPIHWYAKAWSYASTSHYLMVHFENIKDGEKLEDVGHLFNAIQAVPFITGIAIELFMKGYLVFQGVDSDELMSEYRHNLKKIRQKCCTYDDKRFLNRELIFFTDKLGEQIMSKGGIRYPDKLNTGVYFEDFNIALITLEKITTEISSDVVK